MVEVNADHRDCDNKAPHAPHTWMERETFPMLLMCQGVLLEHVQNIPHEDKEQGWPPEMEKK